jgi:acyl transferase domain-containing protein/thioesterase domain-containing protein/acyl carrier protein
MTNEQQSGTDIAIVGMAAHLPGAQTVDQYWKNLRDGVESIRHLTRDDLIEAGEAPHLIDRPDYVSAAAVLEGFKGFDADFWGLGPQDAAIMDPQHRQFLEVSWEALENAGHMPEKFDGPIGVFAGCGMGSYFYFNICSNPDLVQNVGMFLLRHTGNDKDFMSTRLSHILDLKGPSMNVQTACSTSLVATHYACQSLLNGECDMALAGGVTIELPHARGYLFKEGEILSPDGHCHAFDHRAQGTVFGSGAGVVVLRRLEDAIKDGDHIWGVIKSSAVNNDGADKAGYLAPSVEGQAAAIADAHALAEIPADTIDYVECHGTGTYLGDPIEVAALTSAFRESTDEVGFCRIGSVKTNIGHLDTAAGVASLIKASLGLTHKQMPPSLGYERPNPAIDFDGSPFQVNDRLTDWTSHKGPRRAGVNSLGVGGTNAHVVVEEAPERAASDEADFPFQLLALSARSKKALDDGGAKLAEHLRGRTDQPLADVAWTLKEGRRAFDRRRVIVAETHEEAAELLEQNDPRRVFTHQVVGQDPDVVFMFPGGGAQYAGMARDLYETEPVFADWMDKGLEILQPKLDYDIRALWLPEEGAEDAANEALKKPSVQLPLIMITEYALAQLWMSWGVKPAALIGHSMGENTAACLAGVMSFEDCIGLVHLRGTLFDTVPSGGMLSVPMDAQELRPLLGTDLDLGAVNAPGLSVASGPQEALDALADQLAAMDIQTQRIPIDIAAHSSMLDPILGRFGDYLRSITLNAPQIPFVSNRTGAYIADSEATDPSYWVDHLRGTVHFADGIRTLSEQPERVYIEVGPGKALASLTGQHPNVQANQVIGTLRHPDDQIFDDKYFMAMLGRVWAVGVDFDWHQIWGEARRNRVPLPTYAFQRSDYFIEPGTAQLDETEEFLMRSDNQESWGYRPFWKPQFADIDLDVSEELGAPQTWLIFKDDTGLADQAATRLRDGGHRVVTVVPGDGFAQLDDVSFVVSPERGRDDYDELIQALAAQGLLPDRIGHFWLVTDKESFRPGSSFFHRNVEQGFYALMFLAQALSDEGVDNAHLTVVTSGAAQIKAEPLPYPEKSTVMGPARVIPREFPGMTCSVLDIETKRKRMDLQPILEELLANPANGVAALRGQKRFAQIYRHVDLAEQPVEITGGTVLITGGFGGIGLTIAAELIEKFDANIVLLSRGGLPDRAEWASVLAKMAPNASVVRRIQAVQELEALGGKVLVIGADVSNVEEMKAAKAQAESEFGPITGVIHAAGVISDAPILGKSLTEIEDVFTPKIHGTQVLDGLFPDGSLDWMVLFSSSSTVTAPAGQVDYVAANEYLNAFAKARQGGKTRVLAIDWGIWADVGMAAEAMAARTGSQEPAPETAIEGTLLDWSSFDAAGDRTFGASYTPQERWVLDDHRTRSGEALLPGTGYLELAYEALRAQGETGAFEIRNLTFLAPLQVDDLGRSVRVTLPRSDLGYDFLVESAGPDGVFEENAQAELSLLPITQPDQLDLTQIEARCPRVQVSYQGHIRSPQEAHLTFGPRWHVLRQTALGEGEGVAHLSLDPAYGGDKCGLHPGLMDLATGWAMELIEGYQPTHLWVPMSYGSVQVFQPVADQIVSHVRNASANNADAMTASFDVTICKPDGTVCVKVKGFTIRQLDKGFEFARRTTEPQAEPVARPLSPAELRLQHNLSQGIRPTEGAQAFFRAMATGLPQVVVSSMDLDGLIAQAAVTETTDGPDQKFERPELDSEYVAPEGDTEEQLAAIWQDLLGVDQIGAEDSFFDLGGHSLVAVRLFAKVKKAFGVDFPISVLFEAPTIRKCAAMIIEAGGIVEGEPQEDAQPQTPKRRFTHIVPMHSGEGGPETPFFLVAGMFGNVLNLRHLAHLVGHDRPFYGLQARGLYGEDAPHNDLVQAAKDYIAEIRQVQPHGPYMVGGFSGGGITAYEIAQQLKDAGEEVQVLVMLDTPLPVRRPLTRQDRMAIQKQELKEGGLGYIAKWAINRVKWEFAKRRGIQAEQPETGHSFHNEQIEAAFLRSVAKYQVRPWDGPLCLFRPPLVGKWEVAPGRWVNSERAYVLEDNDWTQHAPNIAVFEVPGDHDSMVLEPNVRVLAARIRDCIARAERSDPPAHIFKEAAE